MPPINTAIPSTPSLVIIIDAWPTWNGPSGDIKSFCENSPYVKAIAIASYPGLNSTDGLDWFCKTDTEWWLQSKRLFRTNSDLPWMRAWWDQSLHVQKTLTDPIITGMKLRSDQIGFFALTEMQILYYCNSIDPTIENIFFFGGAWGICVKNRPIGWLQLAAMNKHGMFRTDLNFYTHQLCICDSSFPVEITQPWAHQGNRIYKLDQAQINWDLERQQQPFI